MRGTEKQKEWVAFIGKHPGCNNTTLVNHFKIGRQTVNKYLHRLEAMGAISSTGAQGLRIWFAAEVAPPKDKHWHDVALEIIRRKEGASREQIRAEAGISCTQFDRFCKKYKAEKQIEWAGSGRFVRWYAYGKAPESKRTERTMPRVVPEKKLNGFQTHPCTLPGSLGQRKYTGPVIVPADVKRSTGPNWSHDPRYQCAPGEQPHGAGFAALGVGRYL